MIKSPLRYPGGKSKAIKQISKLIPKFKEFREPFVGGGSVYVYLKQKHPHKTFWINDIYNALFHFWSECRDHPEQLIQQIWDWKKEYQEGKPLHRFLKENINTFDPLKKAAAFFVFNRITFSGTSESGGFSNGAFEKRFTHSSIDRVELLSSLLPGTKITNEDYSHLLNKPGKDVFVFLDPPYYSATKSALYGKNGNLHKGFNHAGFAENMKQTNHKWLITYDDSEYIRDLFSFANIRTWNITYGMRNVTKKSKQQEQELFIANYDIEETLQKQLTLFPTEFTFD
ncbi:DNA methyltransferase [hydrothermal vent metagenome]|uniref:site-specific DNA-methyltransferase (adenine-specific) n=1 Tax=hydrothermal vent metagenome TaxID=652676 RepID=A0A3B1E0M5_9ZZZZ